MFDKPIQELTGDDILAVCEAGIPEGDVVEFKQSYPGKNQEDPWASARNFKERGRDEILAELVAFANAYGGTLILGIKETTDSPGRAEAVSALPDCAELADRFRKASQTCIEPPIPGIKVHGVAMTEEGDGVVVFRVPKSRMAPHRLIQNKECYIRRADRTETMTMREIQDLTLHVFQGMQRLDNEFAVRAEKFASRTFEDYTSAIRLTALPLVPLYFDISRANARGTPTFPGMELRIKEGDSIQQLKNRPERISDWRPVVRGMVAYLRYSRPEVRIDLTVTERGLVETVITYKGFLDVEVCLSELTRILLFVERLRNQTFSPDAEFALEMEVKRAREGGHYLKPASTWDPKRNVPPLPPSDMSYPRYSVGVRSTFEEIIHLVHRDLWNTAGHHVPDCTFFIGEQNFVDHVQSRRLVE